MMQLQTISNAIGATLLFKSKEDGSEQDNNVLIKGVTTDSRTACTGQLFVALKGERFDAHDYVAQAEKNGATAALLERQIKTELPVLLVENSLQSLGKTAKWWRHQFEIPVIGITGSVGKTTVKEMLGSIFAQTGKGVVTQGNLNNEIGVPLTLTRLQKDDLYAIVEMGMSNAGEISRLTDMVQPNVALINNAAAAHLEELGTLQAVAKAKGEIFEGLAKKGTAVINADDEFADYWKKLVGDKKIISFGLHKPSDVTAGYQLVEQGSIIQLVFQQQEIEINLPLMGKHNVSNALAAASVALAAGLSLQQIRDGLQDCNNAKGRLQRSLINGVTVIDDTYNANPASMRAAIDVLAAANGVRKVLIVGDMGELGATSESAHIEVGEYAKHSGIDELYACGELSQLIAQGFGKQAYWFDNKQDLLNELKNKLTSDWYVLVKASRFAAMEEVVDGIHKILTTNNFSRN